MITATFLHNNQIKYEILLHDFKQNKFIHIHKFTKNFCDTIKKYTACAIIKAVDYNKSYKEAILHINDLKCHLEMSKLSCYNDKEICKKNKKTKKFMTQLVIKKALRQPNLNTKMNNHV